MCLHVGLHLLLCTCVLMNSTVVGTVVHPKKVLSSSDGVVVENEPVAKPKPPVILKRKGYNNVCVHVFVDE